MNQATNDQDRATRSSSSEPSPPPPARVFAAWADPAGRARWASPGRDWVLAEDGDDFRAGGHEVSRFGPPDDPMFRAETNYFDIVPDRWIVMAERDVPISASMATVELLPAGDASTTRTLEGIRLEKTGVHDVGARSGIRFQVVKQSP